MKRYSDKELQKLIDAYSKLKVKCAYCGHKEVIPLKKDKQLCSWCGHYIYRNKQME